MRKIVTYSWIILLLLVSVAEAQNLNAPVGRLNATAPVKLRIDAENSKMSAITQDLISDFNSSEKKNEELSEYGQIEL